MGVEEFEGGLAFGGLGEGLAVVFEQAHLEYVPIEAKMTALFPNPTPEFESHQGL
jgi:hypothetical protein